MRVLITTKLLPEGFLELGEKYELVFPEKEMFSRSEVLKMISEFDAFIPTFQFKVDKEILDAAKGSIKIIANYGVGYNNIDVDYATSCGIVVTNTPHPVIEPTAELAMALMLTAARRVNECDRKMRIPGGLKWGVLENLGVTLYGKTLGIIGLGRIGQSLARRAIANGMKIVYYNRKKLAPSVEEKFQASYMSMEQVLSKSDVVSIHTPLSTDTFHLINAERLKLMKRNAILINTARGPIVDELALIEALKKREIYSAALDVFEFEPTVSEQLLTLDNVVLSPHNGTATVDARNAMSRCVSKNIIRFFEGSTDISRVN